jgi:hypothetical protein
MPEIQKYQFPQLTSNKKEVLCVLGQYVLDREARAMSQDDRDELVKETARVIRSIMALRPRRL